MCICICMYHIKSQIHETSRIIFVRTAPLRSPLRPPAGAPPGPAATVDPSPEASVRMG